MLSSTQVLFMPCLRKVGLPCRLAPLDPEDLRTVAPSEVSVERGGGEPPCARLSCNARN